jgi:hypothetical protein
VFTVRRAKHGGAQQYPIQYEVERRFSNISNMPGRVSVTGTSSLASGALGDRFCTAPCGGPFRGGCISLELNSIMQVPTLYVTHVQPGCSRKGHLLKRSPTSWDTATQSLLESMRNATSALSAKLPLFALPDCDETPGRNRSLYRSQAV